MDYCFLEQNRIIPVVVLQDVKETVPTLSALQKGGIRIAEITFRTACAKEAIKVAAQQFPEMRIGAGTVINAQQCQDAIAAGATFIVSPGFSEEVAQICIEKQIPYLPGTVTPTEIMNAISYGFHILKFFPAGVYGGLNAIKALSAAFPEVSFVPTGGVDEKNLQAFLSHPAVAAIGGSFMMKGSPAEIEQKSKDAVKKMEAI